MKARKKKSRLQKLLAKSTFAAEVKKFGELIKKIKGKEIIVKIRRMMAG